MERLEWESLKHNRLLQIIILGVSILICYYGLWNAYFSTVDDFGITGRILHRDTLLEAAAGFGRAARFLNYAMIWVKTRLFELNPSPYFWCSLIQHTLVTLGVYWLAELLTRQRPIAFLAALLFAIKFSYWEVVTGVSASDYSFWTIFYLLTAILFIRYFRQRKRYLYLGSLLYYTFLAFAHDFTLNIPLILLAYHLTLGWGGRPLRSLRWADFKVHFPYWCIWGIHVALQIFFVVHGTAEALGSQAVYSPGLHIVSNLYYLVNLIFPNIPIYDFLSRNATPLLVEAIYPFSTGLAILLHALAIYTFWKGSPVIRFCLSMIYLPFLQYTLWQGGFAGAPRYLYLPSIGFSILFAVLFIRLYEYLRERKTPGVRFVALSFLAIWLIYNFAVIRVWVNRYIANGEIRRTIVTQMATEFRDIESEASIYIEVPEEKFRDLQYACYLLFEQPPLCVAFLRSEVTREAATSAVGQDLIYIFQATTEGLRKIPSPLDLLD